MHSQIIFYEDETWCYHLLNINKEIDNKKLIHAYDMDWDILNSMWAPIFQGSITNPDAQFPQSQISFYEPETCHYYWFNINKEEDKKSKSMFMTWTETS